MPDTNASAPYFDAATGKALATVRGVTSVSAVRSDNARVLDSTVPVNGIDGATITGVYRFAWKDGSDAVLTHLGNGAIVDSKWAQTHKLSGGSPLQVQASNGTTRTFVIRATYHPKFQAVFGGILMDRSHFDRMSPNRQNGYVFVNVASGASPSATAALAKSLRPFTDVTVQTTPSWITTQLNSIKTTLAVFYAFLALSVIVSLFGWSTPSCSPCSNGRARSGCYEQSASAAAS